MLSVVDLYAAGRDNPDTGADQAAHDLLTQARHEADQIVQSARDEAAQLKGREPAPGVLEPDPALRIPMRGYKDASGAVWLCLGTIPTKVIDLTETERACTRCGETKPIDQYHLDVKGRNGRRARCASCTARKKAVTKEV